MREEKQLEASLESLHARVAHLKGSLHPYVHIANTTKKQIQTLNKLCSNLLEKLNNPRDDRDSETSALRQNKPSFNPADTNALVAAVGFGKGLSKCRPPGSAPPGHPGQPMMSTGPTLQQVTIAGTTGHQAGMGGQVAQQQPGQPGTTFNNIHKHIYAQKHHLNTINKVLKNEKTPSYRSQVIIPLLLSE
uniref:Mediator of RNA polymerase II transcription subunit 8 n=1 Tax=Sinocyclocheilus anshuiensis TaxID=1608454 RepID=A0A671P6C8_9TELE